MLSNKAKRIIWLLVGGMVLACVPSLATPLPPVDPNLVNTFIALFKDTSLVLIIGLFDLLSTIKISLTEPAWNGFGIEAYVFASLVYFAFCFAMSRYSKSFERR